MSLRRRVVHVISDLRVGGAQQLLVAWAAEAGRRDEAVTVVALSPSASRVQSQLEALGVEVLVLKGTHGPLGIVEQILRLRRRVRQRHPAVVQTHLTRAHLVGLVAAALAGAPGVATLHSARVGNDGNSGRALRAETLVLRRLAAVVIACGTRVEEAQRKRLRPRGAVVVPNTTEPVPPISTAHRMELRRAVLGGDSADVPLVLAVGRLTEAKGYEDLLRAFALVVPRADAMLVIVGEGTPAEVAALLALQEKLGIEHRIRLLGGRDDVPALLRSADLYVAASRWEGLPIALLEAMAADLPVVATAVGDVPTVVVPGSGVLVPPEDIEGLAQGMLEFLHDDQRRVAAGRAAGERVAAVAGVAQWYDRMRDAHEAAVLRGEPRTRGRARLRPGETEDGRPADVRRTR